MGKPRGVQGKRAEIKAVPVFLQEQNRSGESLEGKPMDLQKCLAATKKMGEKRRRVGEGTRRGEHITPRSGLSWTDFRYEHMPSFCYYCGVTGHDESSCRCAEEDGKEGENRSKKLSPWLKAKQIGKRVEKGDREKGEEAEERSWPACQCWTLRRTNTTNSTEHKTEEKNNRATPVKSTKKQETYERGNLLRGVEEGIGKEESKTRAPLQEVTNTTNEERPTLIRKWKRQARDTRVNQEDNKSEKGLE
ncbi:hypothetical protein PIB30_002453 [Stylosanthes scabra]|uniref:Zinc knuckle CX2CX4HX4C domain-containing protein n=1 Tax=Stylosanthes scabra TaxID=79078 RepID=A0ABU6W1I5_9FABA|nr:hypothetical protein [Stylosanthes scabra]